jgi:tyrosine-protein kinase Etk/Wzc
MTPPDELSRSVYIDPAGDARLGSGRDDRAVAADSVDLWAVLRRNVVLIAASALLAAVAAAVITTRIAPTYVATAAVRVDQKAWQVSALEAFGFTPGNALATELEILRGRVLAEHVVDSIGLQLAVGRPRIPRGRVFSQVVVDRDAAPGRLQLAAQHGGQVALIDRATGSQVAAVGADGYADAGHVRFRLADGASTLAPVDLEVRTFRRAVAELRDGLEITRRNRDAEIIDVRFRGRDAVLASEIVNTLATGFVQGRQDLRRSDARNAVRFLSDQLARADEQLAAAELALRRFRERESIVSLPEEASSGVRRQAELAAQRHALEAERAALGALLEDARRPARTSGESSYHSLLAFPTLLRSGMAAEMMTALVAAEEQRTALGARRTADDPDLRTVDTRVAQIHAEIHSLVSTYLQGLSNQVAALDAVLAREGATLRAIPRKELQLAELQRAATSSAATYAMLETRLKEAQIAATASDATVRVVEPAVAPARPASPRPLLNIAIGLLVGTAVGGALGFARELTDRSIHTRKELLTRTGVPVLGIVPRFASARKLSVGHAALRSLDARVRAFIPREMSRGGVGDARSADDRNDRLYTFTASDAFTWLATNLAFVRPEPPLRTLVITSPLSGDGKTTVAGNLALTLARNGRRVLLIDADLRAGRIAAALKLPRSPGLSDWLADDGDQDIPVNRCSRASGVELDVIVSGSATTAASQLLSSDRLRQLLVWAKARYDYAIIDTAPVNVAADAALIAPKCDGVVLVARAGVTEREAIEFAVEQLTMVHAPIAGAVLNDVDVRRDGAYDRTYRYYGQYGAT